MPVRPNGRSSIAVLSRALRGVVAEGKSFDAAVHGRFEPFDSAGELKTVEPPEQVAEHGLHFEPGEMRADAEVLAESEREMRVGAAVDAEGERIVEHVFVAV